MTIKSLKAVTNDEQTLLRLCDGYNPFSGFLKWFNKARPIACHCTSIILQSNCVYKN